MGDARRYLLVDGEFQMTHGRLQQPTIAYETYGELSDSKQNAVLILTGLSASAHVASNEDDPTPGWWEDVVGPGKPIDTNRYFVICVCSLGSFFGSTCPASTDPSTGSAYRLTFPMLTLEDIAHGAKCVVDHFEITRLHSIVGASMGGMSTLAFALMYPLAVNAMLNISAGANSQPFSIALRSLQRELVCNDPKWLNGEYPFDEQPNEGMRLARKLGMISYRSAQEWRTRFGRERDTDHDADLHSNPFGMDFEIEVYLSARARSFMDAFDANCYLYLSRAIDLFDAADHGGSLQLAINNLGIERATILGVQSDFLFLPDQQLELKNAMTSAGITVDFEILESIQGHDSFLVDMNRFRPAIAAHFNR